jgi:protein SCO1/2
VISDATLIRKRNRLMQKSIAIAAAAILLTGLSATAYYTLTGSSQHQCSGSTIAGGKAAIGGPFELVDHTGVTVTDKDVITGPTLVYFGFTYCPDVCPLDTARNAEAIDLLDAMGHDVKPVFISIDPARDTPPVLADFVEVLHPKMVGLTGTPEQVKAASKAYKTYYRKNGEGEDYLMDHSTFSYLMGPDGLWEFFRREVPADEMAETVSCFIEQA